MRSDSGARLRTISHKAKSGLALADRTNHDGVAVADDDLSLKNFQLLDHRENWDPSTAIADRVAGVHVLVPLSFEQSLSTLPVSTMPTPAFSVPLPASWTKHAKAATLHVISLAHFALTHVRGWAANSPILRVRLVAERDQLNSEVTRLVVLCWTSTTFTRRLLS